MRKSWSCFFRRIASVCFVCGASAWSSAMCYAQSAADNAADPVYADGWQAGDNGGFGFGPWDFTGTANTAEQHAINSTSPYNQLGTAWTLYNPEGPEPGIPGGPTDLSQAGRPILGGLQPGQTISVVFDNPIERRFFRGYTVRLNTGGGNTVYQGTPAARFAVGTFEYQTDGKWYASGSGGNPPFFDTETDMGTRIDVTLTGDDTYDFVMTPLDDPGSAFTTSGMLEGTGPIDWIELEMYNTDSDFYPELADMPQATDFYIRSMTITSPTPQWNVDANGNWSTPTNWAGAVPNAVGATAVLGNIITQPRTVTVDVPITVGRIDFDDANAYTIAGSNAITLDVTTGSAQINVTTGSHVISAPITLADNTTVTVTPAAGNLTFAGTVNSTAVSLTNAGAGTLTANNVRAMALAANGGTVAIAPGDANAGTSVLGSLTIAGATDAWTARLNLNNNNNAIVNSTAAGKAADFGRLYNQLKQGFNNGTWQGLGITSSTAATNPATDTGLTVVDNALLGFSNFSGQPVTANSILLKYTYYGDIDQNGQVDADDLTVFANSFGRTSGATQVDGDIDFNGAVNADDLTVFANNFLKGVGSPLAAGGVQAVPEPQTIGLVIAGLVALPVGAWISRRRREHRRQ